MADFISREAALFAVVDAVQSNDNGFRWGEIVTFTGGDIIKLIKSLPAADVRPVVRGKWWPAKDGYYGHVMCSVCHKIESHKTDFCPNCGADMMEVTADG